MEAVSGFTETSTTYTMSPPEVSESILVVLSFFLRNAPDLLTDFLVRAFNRFELFDRSNFSLNEAAEEEGKE